MDRQIKKRCIHSVVHEAVASRDGYGDITYQPAVTRSCYREDKNKVVRNLRDEEVISSTQLYFDGLFSVRSGDKFILNDRTYAVQSFSAYDGLRENTGTTVVYL